jgi:hypothetical protein
MGSAIITTIILHPFGCIIIVDSGGGWSWGDLERRWRNISIDAVILMHLLFFKVTYDDNVVVIGWPKKIPVEIAEQLAGEVLIPRSIQSTQIVVHLLRRKVHHQKPLRRLTVLIP